MNLTTLKVPELTSEKIAESTRAHFLQESINSFHDRFEPSIRQVFIILKSLSNSGTFSARVLLISSSEF